MNKKIDPKKFYTLYEIIKDELISGCNTYGRMKNIILNDAVTGGPLKAMRISKVDDRVQYRVRGINIIKYLAMKDDQKS